MSSATYRSGLHVVSLRFGASAGKGNTVGAPPTGAPLRVSTWEFCCFAREREASEGKLKPMWAPSSRSIVSGLLGP